eukprot:CAMPEP_0201260014 /NCGR_PEP_ID=MMETSP0853-20130426/4323_1 /ASSEMBLY_ACC=CAM_ASM_000640 /TAXON_ID=183588 /ORGANISM="Pseudo-nitzschia fraudulenta, Strain WWA7" /LENGTH=86 /DNA_ID=CAMNT_0047562417 /DNA_START=75 /DNA_END=332 /DNA_ORIENTATION=+
MASPTTAVQKTEAEKKDIKWTDARIRWPEDGDPSNDDDEEEEKEKDGGAAVGGEEEKGDEGKSDDSTNKPKPTDGLPAYCINLDPA